MRSVSGANFKFIWNPIDSSNVSCDGVSLENFYPGDKYVDMVALDVYDGIGQDTSTDAARWSDLLNGVNAGDWTAVAPDPVNGQKFEGYGLDWLAAFGKEHNKLVGLPEWGLDASGIDGGGGDDGYFVTQMASWIKARATGPAIFWNYGGGTLTLDIPDYTADDSPDATAAFKAAFGDGDWPGFGQTSGQEARSPGTSASRALASRLRACWQNSAVTRSLASATGAPSSHIRADDSTRTPLPGA
jgi:hypothetical protein